MDDKKVTCKACGNSCDGVLTYCDACGAKLEELCPLCDLPHSAGARFCPTTGKALHGKNVFSETLSIITSCLGAGTRRHIPAGVLLLSLLFMGVFIMSHLRVTRVTTPVEVSFSPVAKPRIDVVFALDTTGSMGDEIQTVKEKIQAMASEIGSGRPRPDVRYGLVLYRDRGDEYVVRSFPFTRDIGAFSKLVSSASAAGGGDTPESVNEALDVAVNEMGWDNDQSTQKLIFLIGDAGPHMDYANGPVYAGVAKDAARHGISIFTVGCSGIEGSGQQVFRQIASTTGGTFDFLTYQVTYQAPTGETHYMLNAGGRSYAVDEKSVSDGSWKRGASEMAKSEKAREVTGADAPGGAAALSETESKVSHGAARNNLDSLMTGVIKDKAVKMGVTY
ncbi:MAG: VWA domain-containing protein [Candidatus Eremiobacteraeota bacterium]|nr:VWA domain-containing protein [Candidatus Eremiobacteraeota bacterium]